MISKRAQVAYMLSAHLITGTRTLEYDLTPHHTNIDGVMGLAELSTSVTSFNSLGMTVHADSSGNFDAMNGALRH